MGDGAGKQALWRAGGCPPTANPLNATIPGAQASDSSFSSAVLASSRCCPKTRFPAEPRGAPSWVPPWSRTHEPPPPSAARGGRWAWYSVEAAFTGMPEVAALFPAPGKRASLGNTSAQPGLRPNHPQCCLGHTLSSRWAPAPGLWGAAQGCRALPWTKSQGSTVTFVRREAVGLGRALGAKGKPTQKEVSGGAAGQGPQDEGLSPSPTALSLVWQ